MASELIRARSERGLSQSQLAEVSGISRSAIKAYESGRNMPGSRELRSLCLALKVTPNQLLFGTDAPLLDQTGGHDIETYLRIDPEREATARARLAVLSSLLAEDEYQALLLMARSLAVARHGVDVVAERLQAADFMVGMSRGMLEEAARAKKTGEVVDADRVVKRALSFMEDQRHDPAAGRSTSSSENSERDTKEAS